MILQKASLKAFDKPTTWDVPRRYCQAMIVNRMARSVCERPKIRAMMVLMVVDLPVVDML
jgi:hypothetical protein